MYKDTETATLEILNCHRIDIISCATSFCVRHNISRLIVNSDSKEILDYLAEFAKKNPSVSMFYRTIYTGQEWVFKEDFDELGLILQVREFDDIELKCFEKNSNIFVEVTVEHQNQIERYLGFPNCIWNLRFCEENWKDFDSCLEKILTLSEDQVLIRNILLSKQQIQEHPCTVYLCDGTHCHSGHGRAPRYLTILENGDIYPYELINPKFMCGNIFECQEFPRPNREFISVCRSLYLEIMDKCIYEILPWFDLLRCRYR